MKHAAMKVFVDSNQFISDFLLESAPMRYLFHFLNNDGHTLLLSKVVVQEVENKYREKAHEALVDTDKLHDRLVRLGLRDRKAPARATTLPPFDLREQLHRRIDNILLVEYDDIPHSAVVERALLRRRPFDAEGNTGYRDVLIWLSLLEAIKRYDQKDEEVVFISDNWSDFYERAPAKEARGKEGDDGRESRAQPRFHDHLKEDLQLLTASVTPYMSVSAFVSSQVDTKAHEVDYGRQAEAFETYAENEGIDHLRSLEPHVAKDIAIGLFGSRAEALTFLSTDADTIEGLEDLHVQVSQQIDGEDYISCTYNIRGVSLDLHIADSKFDELEHTVEAHPQVWEVVRLEGIVVIRLSVRPYFTASFRYNPQTFQCNGYSVARLAFR